MEEEVNPKEEESRKEKEQQQVLAEIRARIKHLKQFPAKYTKMDLQSAEEELKSKTPCRKEKESELYAELLILNGRQEEIDKEYKRKTKENEEQLEAIQQQMEALQLVVSQVPRPAPAMTDTRGSGRPLSFKGDEATHTHNGTRSSWHTSRLEFHDQGN